MFGWLKPRRKARPVAKPVARVGPSPARERIRALEQLLTHTDAATRSQALARLEKAGYLVETASPAARAAIFVLKRQYDLAAAEGGPAVAPLLLDLDDPLPNPNALAALATVGGPDVARGLEAFLIDPRRSVGSVALIAPMLRTLGWRPDTAEGRAAVAAAGLEFERAADEGQAALPFLIRALACHTAWTDQASRDAFFRAVARFGAAAVIGLRDAYFDPRGAFEPCREYVVACLARFPDRRAADALAEVIDSNTYRCWHLLRIATRLTLAGDARAVRALVRRAADPGLDEGSTWLDLLRTLVWSSHTAIGDADLVEIVRLIAVKKVAVRGGTGESDDDGDDGVEVVPLDCSDFQFTAMAELSRRRRRKP